MGGTARIRGRACECGALMHFENGRADCAACGRKYEMKEKNTVKES